MFIPAEERRRPGIRTASALPFTESTARRWYDNPMPLSTGGGDFFYPSPFRSSRNCVAVVVRAERVTVPGVDGTPEPPAELGGGVCTAVVAAASGSVWVDFSLFLFLLHLTMMRRSAGTQREKDGGASGSWEGVGSVVPMQQQTEWECNVAAPLLHGGYSSRSCRVQRIVQSKRDWRRGRSRQLKMSLSCGTNERLQGMLAE